MEDVSARELSSHQQLLMADDADFLVCDVVSSGKDLVDVALDSLVPDDLIHVALKGRQGGY